MAITPGRFVAFTPDYTAPLPEPIPVVPIPGSDGLIDPPKIQPSGPILVHGNGTVSQDVIIPVIVAGVMRPILAGHAVVTPFQSPDLTDGDALMDPTKGYPFATYSLSGVLDGRGGGALTYTITDVPPGNFSLGFVQDNAVPPDVIPPTEVGALPPPVA
jgi:hypothetical protein